MHVNQTFASLTSQACSSRPMESCTEKIPGKSDLLCVNSRHGHTSLKEALRALSGPVFAKASPERAACERYWLLYTPPHIKRQLCCTPKRQPSSYALEKSAEKRLRKILLRFPKAKIEVCLYSVLKG